MMTTDHTEPTTRLVSLAAVPAIWALHFVVSYATAAIWCAKGGGGFSGARLAIGAYTAAALIAIAIVAARAWRNHRAGPAELPDDRDTPLGRHRFVAGATLLVAGLASVAILYELLAIVVAGRCA